MMTVIVDPLLTLAKTMDGFILFPGKMQFATVGHTVYSLTQIADDVSFTIYGFNPLDLGGFTAGRIMDDVLRL